MSAVSMMDDDFAAEDENRAPRPRKRKAAPPRAARGKPPGKRAARARRRIEADEEAPLGLIAGWIADARLRMKRSAAFATAVGLFFGAAALSGFFVGGHAPDAIANARASALGFLAEGGLKLQHIKIAGRGMLPEAEIKAATGLKEGVSSIFDADPHAIRERLLKIKYVAHAQVRRVWPDRLEILIVERRPLALWQSDGVIHVVDRTGTPFAPHDPSRFPNLLLVVGPGAAEQAENLIATLDRQPHFKSHVRSAIRVGQRRWNLRLDNGVEVRLPEQGAEAALSELVKLDGEQQILSRQIDAIDLRFPDRLIVKLPDDSPLLPRKPAAEGKDT